MVIDTLKLLTSDNVDYANIVLVGSYNAGAWFGYGSASGILSVNDWNTQYNSDNIAVGLTFNSVHDPNYHSIYYESRPKTKFFSLMIYAGYPIA